MEKGRGKNFKTDRKSYKNLRLEIMLSEGMEQWLRAGKCTV